MAESKLISHQNRLNLLVNLPDQLKVGSRFYRFATFTAEPGSAVSEQLMLYATTSHHEQGAVANKGAKGTSKLPRVNERALLKEAKKDADVPDGMLRQYFCYADGRSMGIVAEKIEIPSEFKNFAKFKGVKIPNKELSHFDKFDTTSLEQYIVSLQEEFESMLLLSGESIENALRQSQRLQDIRNTSGFSVVGGPEAIFKSATISDSKGGFLINLQVEEAPILYCPECAQEALKAYSSSNGGTESGIVFPPIPAIAFPSGILCTENIHKGEEYSHTEADCVSIDKILSEIAAIRRSTGQEEFSTYNLHIPSSDLLSSHGEYVWMGT
tara:strand:- start:274 stop:1251 length:978 start_codon:yes stop_codon:yes gene_type:complete